MNVDSLSRFEQYLREEEKSGLTVEKYLRDLRAFLLWAGGGELSRELVIRWKQTLVEAGYKPRSINSMLASVNAWLRFIGREDCRVKSLRLQRQIYQKPEEDLSRAEYQRLLTAARRKPRLYLLLQTICATGIRVSELRYFTAEAVALGEITVSCKNKTRVILIPDKLKTKLLRYAKDTGVTDGAIFRTRGGKPLDRSNIHHEMKALCAAAGVAPEKVFPHNLRKLFARLFYGLEKDIAKLADVLGHTSINTTRIYIMTTAAEHRRQLERLHLLI